LSQAFIKTAGAETISFHLSPDSVTIDLNKSALSPEIIDAAEDLANRIIEENRAVQAWYPTEEEREALQLRKVPDVEGRFRVVAIDGFDATACGGTHVGYTGEIGLVKVIKADRRGDTMRVEFRCGKRALHDYREKNALLNQLSAELTTGYWDVPAALERLREQNKTQQRELKALKTALLESEATQLWQTADRSAGYALILHAFEGRDASEVRQIAQQLITHPATVVLCGTAGEKSQLIAARSEDLPYDMVPVLMRGLLTLGVERGGGRPSFAQGGGITATQAAVQAALLAAAKTLSSNA
jgi:alanyl-tRNA synthetase